MARREERRPLAMNAQCRSGHDRRNVALWDLSSHGCRIVLAGMVHIAVGQRIVLRPEGLESLSGTVRWRSEEFAGVEFDRALHPAVVDHLCRLHPDDSRMEMEMAA